MDRDMRLRKVCPQCKHGGTREEVMLWMWSCVYLEKESAG